MPCYLAILLSSISGQIREGTQWPRNNSLQTFVSVSCYRLFIGLYARAHLRNANDEGT